MKTPKLFHLMMLLVVAVAPLFFPAPAMAVSGAWVNIPFPFAFVGNTGPYTKISWEVETCSGDVWSGFWPGSLSPGTPFTVVYTPTVVLKSVTVTFTDPGEESISACSGYCGCPSKSNKVSTCGGFYIPKRVPRSPAIPVSFKGPGNITSANIYFKDLGYSLPLWLHHYDWGSGKWYGYLNTTYLPLGKHHGRVNTYVDGVRGGGCDTGGFKVVEE